MNELHLQPFSLAPAASAAEPAVREAAKAEQAAVKFEGLFIGEMLKQMRRSAREIAGEDGMFQSQTHGSLLELADTMVADAMAGQRAFGVADAILQQLLAPAAPAADGPLKFSPATAALKP